METTYVTTALQDFFNKYKIVRTHVARLFSQTNNIVLNRWLSGKDLYVSSLLKICNAYDMDLLSFFQLGGHSFTTTLHDLLKFEEAGLKLTDVMREKGIDPANVKKYRSLAKDVNTTTDTVPAKPNDLKDKQPEDEAEAQTGGYATMSADILDRFVQMQTSAYAHEQEALRQLRADMQMIIDRQDAQIKELQKELKKYKHAAAGIKFSMMQDDTEIAHEAKDK